MQTNFLLHVLVSILNICLIPNVSQVHVHNTLNLNLAGTGFLVCFVVGEVMRSVLIYKIGSR